VARPEILVSWDAAGDPSIREARRGGSLISWEANRTQVGARAFTPPPTAAFAGLHQFDVEEVASSPAAKPPVSHIAPLPEVAYKSSVSPQEPAAAEAPTASEE
jgi:hypothetical protein